MSAREGRIARRFAELARAGRSGLVAFVTAGDPDAKTSAAILNGLAEAGADVIELGMPFSDPMADGPAIQQASLRALKSGITLAGTLDLLRAFRATDDRTPVVLMGYYNPIYSMGAERFIQAAKEAGADGLIIVDLPIEEVGELEPFARQAGIDLIRLVAPTTTDARLPRVVEGASGFIYYVSVLGITGTRAADAQSVAAAVARIRRATALPVAVGFGIKTAEQAAAVARAADACVVGSALVGEVAAQLDGEGRAKPGLVDAVHGRVRLLAQGVREARLAAS